MTSSIALFLVAASLEQQPDLPPFVKEYSQAAMNYYKAPDPTLGPKMLNALIQDENLKHPFFIQREEVARLIASQIGDIGTGRPKIVRQYEAAFSSASAAGKRVVLRALENCGDADTVKQVATWLAEPPEGADRKALEALKVRLEDPKRKHARDKPAKEPLDLDFLWGNFFITGEYAPVSRILDVFDLPDAKENETLKRVARWSFGSNLQQHPKLAEIVLKHKNERPAGSKKAIDEMIIVAPKP